MFQNLSIFQTAGQLARHSAARQVVVARNLANVNTPSFKAQDIPEFQAVLRRTTTSPSTEGLKTSRTAHISLADANPELRPQDSPATEQKPNGNSVFLENETLKAIEAERRHSRALAIYNSSLSILRTSLGRGR